MTYNIKYYLGTIALVLLFAGCDKKEHSMGNLIAPSNVVISTKIIGQDATHPDGDGSGNVEISLSGDNVLAYKIDYGANDVINPELLASGKTTYQYTNDTLKTYRITVIAYGSGATSTTVTKDIKVRFTYNPDPALVTSLIGSGSKGWRVNKDIAGHFGVGPWDPASVTPSWWSAAVNEKVACCNCFYTATFTFAKTSAGYTLTVATPDGAFTKTGDLAGGLPGIPASGDEACYPYSGGSSSFSFIPSKSGVSPSSTTGVTIALGGSTTFIGYGAVKKTYEILSITDTSLYLRVQGTETGNAWYLILKAI